MAIDCENKFGAMGAFSLEERNEHYANDICTPTTDEVAVQLERFYFLREAVEQHEPETILDIGCHDGFMTRPLLRYLPYVKSVIGVDLNKEALKAARVERKEDENLVYIESDIFHYLQNNTQQYDCVVMGELIEHFKLSEVFDLIKLAWSRVAPGGILFISTPEASGPYGLSNPEKEHLTMFTAPVLEHVLDDILEHPSDVLKTDVYLYALVKK